jgi:hypothetical protein
MELVQPSTILVECANQGEAATARLGGCSPLASYRRGAGLDLPGSWHRSRERTRYECYKGEESVTRWMMITMKSLQWHD